jgi:trk system potassium uptake protein
MAKDYLVIGMGRFGQAVARRLIERGQSVLAADNDAKLIQDVSEWATQAVVLDSTDRDALIEIECRYFDTAIVAIGANFEASVMTTALLKELGVRTVIAKALSSLHEKVLLKVGADEVIYPERDAGFALSDRL